MPRHNETPILITGCRGQLGRALIQTAPDQNILPVSRERFDLSRPQTLKAKLQEWKPRAIFNAAAYTAVDLAEKEQEQAFLINAEAVGVMAQWCAEAQIPLVHVSTDYVFSGEGSTAWSETDPTGPLNVYGVSKLEGEKLVQQSGAPHLIARTSWVYDETGKNFLNSMLRLGSEREELRVVADQVGSPTYAAHLAQALWRMLEDFPSGIYHVSSKGETSWHGFAQKIFEEARKRGFQLKVERVMPIATSEYPTPARRPLNSRLQTERLKRTFGIEMPPWQQGLIECLEAKRES